MATSRKTVRAVMRGRVQGVWYRGWTVDEATTLGLSGWVRNRFDGSVEAVFAGPGDDVDEMLRRCHDGPSAARVGTVEVEPWSGGVEAGFRQLPSG